MFVFSIRFCTSHGVSIKQRAHIGAKDIYLDLVLPSVSLERKPLDSEVGLL